MPSRNSHSQMLTQSILVAEDSPDDMFFLERLLKKAGASNVLQVAENGAAAIQLLSEMVDKPAHVTRPRIAFLDIKMPLVDGFETLAWIRQQSALNELPVVMLSSSRHLNDVTKAAELGAQCYLSKYPTETTLAEVLAAAEKFDGQQPRQTFAVADNLIATLS